MQPVTELPLPRLALEDPAFSEDPFPHFEAARAQHPWLAKAEFGYVVTEYEAMKELMTDPRMQTPQEVIVDFMKARDTRWGQFQLESLMAIGGADHKRIRDVLAPAFTPRAANNNRGLMRATVSRLLDEWAPKGKFDFGEFASNFPIQVMCSLIGADFKAIPQLRASMEAISLSFSMDPDFLPVLEKAVVTMEDYVTGLVAERDARGPSHDKPDMLDELIAVRNAGGLNDAELRNLLVFLFVAGYDTSKNSLTLTMHALLSRPEMYERCAEDPAYCRLVVEESLRYRVASAIYRTTSEDIVYRDVLLPKGTMLYVPAVIATRVSGAVSDPHEFNPERHDENRHIAFGRGAHMCLGQYIARAQIEEGLHLIAQRIKNPKLAGQVGASRPFAGGWHFNGLPIEFTPAPPRSQATPLLVGDEVG